MGASDEGRVPRESIRGWVVVVAALMVHTISHGIIYSFGHLFVALQDTFDASKADLSWIGSICTGALFLVGPLGSVLINRLSFRLVTIIGCCVTSAGYVISVFAPSLPVLYVTAGAMAGCGFGLMFQAAVIVVTESFSRHRALACGVAISGCGIGAFIFNPLSKILLDIYGWRGTLLILAGINLNCLPCALVMISQKENIQPGPPKHSNLQKYEEVPVKDYDVSVRKPNGSAVSTCQNGRHDASLHLEKVPLNSTEGKTTEDKLCKQLIVKTTEDCDIYCQHSVGLQKVDVSLGGVSERLEEKIVIEIVDTNYPDDDADGDPSCSGRVLLLKDKMFAALVAASFLMHCTVYVPFIYIPDRSREQGLDETQTVWVVSTIGLTSIAGRIGVGYLVDSFSISRLKVFALALFLAGSSTALGPLYRDAWSLLMYAVTYGVSFGVVISFLSIITADIVGLHRLNNAYGLVGFFNGIGTLIGPPFAGFLFDSTGSYDLPFLVLGLVTTCGSILFGTCAAVVKPRKSPPRRTEQVVQVGLKTDVLCNGDAHRTR